MEKIQTPFLIVKKTGNRGMQYSEWLAEKNGKPTYMSMVRRDIDEAVKAADTDKEFFDYLKEKGYEFKLYTDKGRRLERPSLRPKDSVRYFRFDRLKEELELIREENRKGEKENELFRRRSGADRENVPKRG